jgi:hypothetical protein
VTNGHFEQEINKRQNEDDMMRLRFASGVAHARGRRIEGLRALIVALFACAAVLSSMQPSLADPLAIAGVAGTVVTELLAPLWSNHWTRLGMLFQERFDTELFAIPWNSNIGERPLDEAVVESARAFAGDSARLRNWYVDVSKLPRAYAVLLCQRENLVWDFRQRRAWADWIAAGSAAWLSFGLVVALATDWTVRDFFLRWLAPSLPLVVLSLRQAFTHRSIATAKQDAAGCVESLLSRAPSGRPSRKRHADLLREARRLQDVIARERGRSERVPQFFYRMRREGEEAAAQTVASEIRARLLAAGS